jgi:hypothetical protein
MSDPHDSFRDYNDELSQIDDSVSGSQLPEQESPFNSQSYGFSNNSNNNNLAKNGNLQKAWNGGNKNSSGISADKNDSRKTGNNADGISRKTGGGSTGNPRNPMNYLGGSGKGRTSRNSNSRLNIKAKIRRRIIGGILASVLGLGGIGIGFAGPSLLLNKIADVVEKKFVAPTSMSMKAHVKQLWKCKLSPTCLKSGSENDTEKNMGEISDEAKAGLANNGATVEDAGGASKIVIKDSVSESTPITSENVEDLPPAVENDFQTKSIANSPSAVLAGEPTAAMLETMGASKNIPTSEGVGNDEKGQPKTIGEQLDEQSQNKSGANDLTTESAEAISPGQQPGFVDGNNGTAKEESTGTNGFKPPGSDIDVEPADNVKTTAEDDMRSVEEDVKGGGSKALGTTLNVLCGVAGSNSIANGFRVGVKIVKIMQLAKFAYSFLTVADAIRGAADGGGGPSSEQVSQLANQITTVMKDSKGNITTKSGTDSFGYQMMNGDLISSGGKFNLTNPSKTASVGQPTSFTSSVLADGVSGIKDPISTLLNAPGMNGINITSTIQGLLNYGCAAVPMLISGYTVGKATGLISSGLEAAVSFGTDPVADAQLITGALGALTQFIATLIPTDIPGGKTVSEWLAGGGAISGAASACLGVINSAGAAVPGCIGAIIIAGGVIALPFVIDAIIKNFENTFLKNPLPVGDQSMDAIASGAGASMGMNAGLNGNAPLTNTNGQSTSYLKQVVAYNQKQSEVSRAGSSPFDIYNNDTVVGSFAGNFVASLYSNGSSPLGMAQSLLGMFGSTFANFANGTSAYADAADAAYTSSCGDVDIISSKIAADPFCNPIYGLPKTLSLEDTMTAMNQIPNVFDSPDKVYGLNESAQITGGTVGDFLNECIPRQIDGKFTPMGAGASDQSGGDCVVGGGGSGKFDDNQMIALYNFIQYQLANANINQGSNLGCQGDGSCASSGSFSSSSTSTGAGIDNNGGKVLSAIAQGSGTGTYSQTSPSGTRSTRSG